MADSRHSSVDWERDIYAKGAQLNLWPSSELVSSVLRITKGLERDRVSVLEVGCGAGNNIHFLAKSGFSAAGIDSSPTAIRFAHDRLAADGLIADLRVGDLVSLPFDDGSYDVILDRGALTQNTHANVERALSEMQRVLRPGGHVLCFDLFGTEHPDMLLGQVVSHHSRDHFDGGMFAGLGLTSFFDAEDIKRLFASFDDLVIRRHVEYDGDGRVLLEWYNVQARRA